MKLSPEEPTLTNNPVEVVVEPSSLLLQEMKVKLKRKREKMMSICLTWFPNWLFQENTIYNINRFGLQCVGDFTWWVV